MMLCTFLLTLAFSGVGSAAPEETQTISPLDYGGLRIDITAPIQACPGDNITVGVTTSASDVQQIHIKYITIDLYGVINATTKVYLAQIVHLSNVSVSSHEFQYTIAIPENISPGLTYGVIDCEWDLMGAPQKIPSSGFALTYIENVALEQLQVEYDELNATYQDILHDYTELESAAHEDGDSSRELMYVFIVTTVIASITVVVLLMRKPKKVWV
jgi:hypothetical protein